MPKSLRNIIIIIIAVVLIVMATVLIIHFVIPQLTNSKIVIVDESILSTHFQHDPVEMNIEVKNERNTTHTFYIYLRTYDSTKDWHSPFTEFNGCIPIVNVQPNHWGNFLYSKPLPPGQYQILVQFYGDQSCNDYQIDSQVKGFVVQPDSDSYAMITSVGGIASTGLAIIAIVFQYFNGKSTIERMKEDSQSNLTEMRRQRDISIEALNLAQKEANSRLRPWVSPVSIKATFIEFSGSNAGTVPYDEGIILINKKTEDVENAIVSFDVVIKNTGTIPAIDAKYRFLQCENPFTRIDLNATKPIKIVSIMPGEMDVMTIEIPMKKVDDGDYHVGLSVEYKVEEKISNSGIIWKLTYNNEESIDTWIS